MTKCENSKPYQNSGEVNEEQPRANSQEVKNNEMIALSYYHSSAYDPRQLDFMMQTNMPPVLDSGQYLMFGNHESKPQVCDGIA